MYEFLNYAIKNEQERDTLKEIQSEFQTDALSLLQRGEHGHLTAAAFIFDSTYQRVLLIKHKIFNAYSAPGGHADGDPDLLQVAIREAKEEARINCYPISVQPAALDVLPVVAHMRKSIRVSEHKHFCYTYLLQTDDTPPLSVEGETDSILFIPIDEAEGYMSEPAIIAVYRRALGVLTEIKARKAHAFNALPKRLPNWFLQHKRDLLWRKDKTPYRVFLSEIMLQQTRVEAVKVYYKRFLDRAPDVFSLAEMPEDELKKLWEGLGYYSRMRNLKRAAEIVVSKFCGNFPSDPEVLKTLPGVGDYTAGAVASIAFGKPAAAVDGNVIRVVARVTGCFKNLNSTADKTALTRALTKIYPKGEESDFTESLMELGATVCLPSGAPKCEVCPMADVCEARREGVWQRIPIMPPKIAKKTVNLTVFLLICDQTVALCAPRMSGVLVGQHEFLNIEGQLSVSEAKQFLTDSGFLVDALSTPVEYRHIFTHLIWNMRVYVVSVAKQYHPFLWLNAQELNDIALPGAFRKLTASLPPQFGFFKK